MEQAAVEAYRNDFSAEKRVLYNQALDLLELDFPGVNYFPNFESISPKMKRARAEMMPPIPYAYADIPNNLPEKVRLTHGMDEMFLLLNIPFENKRIIVWAAQDGINAMTSAGGNTFWIDGTFNVCPPPFVQLVTYDKKNRRSYKKLLSYN